MIGICQDKSQPGVPQTNAIIERTVQDVTNGSSTALLAAGLPPCFWPFAVQAYCFLDNTNFHEGASAWAKTHGSEFRGERFPFGCKVVFKPSATQNNELRKDDPKTLVGVFAGYAIKPGYNWSGDYLVWALEDFVNADLSRKATHIGNKLLKPHWTRRCWLYEDKIEFPLKSRYESVNSTIEGLLEDAKHKPRDYGRDGNLVDPQGGASTDNDPAQGWTTHHGEYIPCVGMKEAGVIDYAKCDFPDSSQGSPGDGKVYTNGEGHLCMIDKAGKAYTIRADGTRKTSDASRPLGYEINLWSKLSKDEKKKIKEDIESRLVGSVPKAPHLRIGEDEDLGTGGASGSAGVAQQSSVKHACTGVIDSFEPWKQPIDIGDFYDNCFVECEALTSCGSDQDIDHPSSGDESWDSQCSDEKGTGAERRKHDAAIAPGSTFWMKDRHVLIREALNRLRNHEDAGASLK
jgi:hypothetical protein